MCNCFFNFQLSPKSLKIIFFKVSFNNWSRYELLNFQVRPRRNFLENAFALLFIASHLNHHVRRFRLRYRYRPRGRLAVPGQPFKNFPISTRIRTWKTKLFGAANCTEHPLSSYLLTITNWNFSRRSVFPDPPPSILTPSHSLHRFRFSRRTCSSSDISQYFRRQYFYLNISDVNVFTDKFAHSTPII